MQNFIWKALLLLGISGAARAQTYGTETVVITTSEGSLYIRLYTETPLHRANFISLAEKGTFDSLLFHRVINGFMIQGGDPLSKRAAPGDSLGHGDLGYMVPAEFNRKLIHTRGKLCAARESDDINPERASSASQFYLVQGKKRTPEELKKYEDRINRTRYLQVAAAFMKSEEGLALKKRYKSLKDSGATDSASVLNARIEERIRLRYEETPPFVFSEEERAAYASVGGTPHLDGTYTVFGEVVQGLEVIDRIAAVKTDKRDRPLKDIRMRVKILR